MKYFNEIKNKLSLLWLMWLAIMVLAILLVFNSNYHINRDGLLYLKQAYLISQGSWYEALSVYSWPFFSILIGTLHKLTNLNYQASAHILNLALFGICVLFYLKINLFINKDKKIIFYSGLLLISFAPIMDDYLIMVLRDHGLWAGCMAGVYYYFKYLSTQSRSHCFLWQISFALAGAFRPEGFVFLLFLPIYNLFFYKKQKIDNNFLIIFFKEYFLILLVIFFLMIFKFLDISMFDYPQFKVKVNEFIPLLQSFFYRINSPLPIESNNFYLNKLLHEFPMLITISLLSFIFLYKFIHGLGLLLIYLIFKKVSDKSKIDNHFMISLYFLLSINLVLILISLFNNFVLSGRYFILCYLFVLIILAPTFLSLFEYRKLKDQKIQKFLVISFIFLSLLNIIFESKKFDLDMQASNLLKQLEIKDNLALINSDRLAYYAGLTIKEITNASYKYSDDYDKLESKEWIILNDMRGISNILIPSNFYIYHKIVKNDREIIFYKRRN